MNNKIRINGTEIKDSIVVVDTLNQTVSIETMFEGEKVLDMQKVYAEVNLFGDIDITSIDCI